MIDITTPSTPMNTVIETSQHSPASDGLGIILILVVIALVIVLFPKDGWS